MKLKIGVGDDNGDDVIGTQYARRASECEKEMIKEW